MAWFNLFTNDTKDRAEQVAALKFREPPCPKCGAETKHFCGMGACVQICPKCDRL